MVPESLLTVVAKPAPRLPDRTGLRKEYLDGSVRIDLTITGKIRESRPDIIEVCRQFGLTVVPKGQHWVTNCVFHHDPGPSMVLYTDDNTFHCFGCEAHGDSINLLAKRDIDGRVATI